MSIESLILIKAEIFLLLSICFILIFDVFISSSQRVITFWLSLAAVIITAILSLSTLNNDTTILFSGSVVIDQVSSMLKAFSSFLLAICFIYSKEYLISNKLFKGEYFVLSLFTLLGIFVMISAHNLLVLYLGLEILALSLYTLIAFNRDSATAIESAIKYFVLGAIASGSLLYGISFIYGVTGSIQFDLINSYYEVNGSNSGVSLLALAFILVALAFKFGAAPFHMWLPDVYQGSPAPVTLIIGTIPKIAAFAITWRFLVESLGSLFINWQDIILVLIVASLLLGNLVAIAQTNLKRMLAYSTISHVGYILMGFVAGTPEGLSASLFYTLVYTLTAAAAFGMIIILSSKGKEAENIDDFSGLNDKSPWFAFLFLVVMFSMAGVPPFVGFYAKLLVLSSIIDADMIWLAVIGVLTAVIGAFYYLRVIWYMYFNKPNNKFVPNGGLSFSNILSINAIALIILGFFPGILLTACNYLLL
ncbi:MAG: NADH-quinone oxidoreductase subunit N [Gammaproteobacteria bacterium TMED78]|nr:MAG: NADH-quinone oxidoreductase subunit N [Gammaproteobacteria bacterium TMED78]